MRGHHHIGAGLIQHRSPLRCGRLRAKTEEGQAGGGDDGRADTHGKVHDDGRDRTGKNMAQHNRHRTGAETAGRLDKCLALE